MCIWARAFTLTGFMIFILIKRIRQIMKIDSRINSAWVDTQCMRLRGGYWLCSGYDDNIISIINDKFVYLFLSHSLSRVFMFNGMCDAHIWVCVSVRIVTTSSRLKLCHMRCAQAHGCDMWLIECESKMNTLRCRFRQQHHQHQHLLPLCILSYAAPPSPLKTNQKW